MLETPRVALAAAATVLLLAASCGDDDSSAKPPAAASNLAAAAGSTVAEIPDGPVDKSAFIADLVAAVDAYTSVHLSVKAASMGTGEVDVSYGGTNAPTVASVDTEIAGRGSGRFVVTEGAVYVEQKSPGTFLKIDAADPSYGALLREFSDLGPRAAISGLGAGLISVVRDGTRTVEGIELAAYRAKIDPSKATGPFHALAGTSGIATPMSFRLYLDDENLLRLIEVDGAGTSTVAFTRWGEPVSVAVPTEDQILKP